MKKVSVIIPMYNAEPYIRQCIQSVILQTWSNLEILVIDDGSTDRSIEVCEDLSRIDDRIRILTQNNQRVSAARNRGIEAAVTIHSHFTHMRKNSQQSCLPMLRILIFCLCV